MKKGYVKRPLSALFYVVLVFLILWFTVYGTDPSDPYAHLDKQQITFTGTVKHKEQHKTGDGRSETVFLFRAERALLPDGGEVNTHTAMQVYLSASSQEPETEQRIRLRGTVRCFADATNPGEFETRRYYETRGISFRVFDAYVEETAGGGSAFRESLYLLRVTLSSVIDSCMDEEDAGVMKAMLLGDRSSMDSELKELYRSAGIAHLLAVSGLHFSIVGGCVNRLLKAVRVPQGIAAVCSIVFMVSYALLCGMPLSAVRAVTMFALALVAPRLRRSYDMLSAMSLTGLLMLAEQLLYATDSAFLLSFCAVAGLGVLHPVLERSLSPERDGKGYGNDKKAELSGRVRKGIRAGVLASLSVTLATLPVLLCSYGTFSVYSVLINLLVVPLMTLVMPLGFFTLLPGLFSQAAGSTCALPVRSLLSFYRWICLQNRALPFHTRYAGAPAAWQVAVYYALLALIAVLPVETVIRMIWKMMLKASFRPERKTSRVQKGKENLFRAVVVFLAIALALALLAFRTRPPLQITFLDVGQGDGIVIRNGAHTYLIDGGSTSKSEVGKYQIIPYLKHEGIGYLDAVFVSHEDEDHVNGILELFDDMEKGGIRVGRLVVPDLDREANWEPVLRAQDLGIPVTHLSNGQQLSQGDLVFTCLGPQTPVPEDANEHSMILLMRHKGFSALFTGDVEGAGLSALNETLAALPKSMRMVDILKVAHHGSRFTTDDTFLSLVDADYAVVSCGRNNVYGHPHAETLERLQADGARVLTTQECGAITVTVSKNGDACVKSYLTGRRSVYGK